MKTAKQPRGPIDAALARLPADLLSRLLGSSSPQDPAALRRRAALASDGDEVLRFLKAKRAKLGPPKHDTTVARAVLAIDYLGRNAPDNGGGYCRTTVPAAALAKAAGLGQKKGELQKLEQMRSVLASYLDGTSIGRKSRRGGQGGGGRQRGWKRDASSLKSGAAASSAESRQTVHPSDLMRDMCIRLGPVIPDAEYATSYATRLLETLANMDGSEKQAASKRRRFSKHELRRDMERHREYYEAVCFYLAVKKSEGESAQLLKKAAKKPPAKKDAKKDGKSASRKEEEGDKDAVADGEEEEDADEERTLSEADIISAANLLEGTFRTVLDYVKEWTVGLTIEVLPDKPQAAEPPRALFQVANATVEGAVASKTEPMESPFEQWKRAVLREAKASAMTKMDGKESRDWRTVAADEVLRKAGL